VKKLIPASQMMRAERHVEIATTVLGAAAYSTALGVTIVRSLWALIRESSNQHDSVDGQAPVDTPAQSERQPPQEQPLGLHIAKLLPRDCSAHAIRSALNERVVGQAAGTTALSVLFSMHLSWFEAADRQHTTPNALLLGPTGVGKTHSLRALARHLSIPFIIVDSTALSPAGYVGLDVEEIVEQLVDAAESILSDSGLARRSGDTQALAERGVIVFDEFDKLRRDPHEHESFSKGHHVQQRLLKMIEGAHIQIGLYKNQSGTTLDTSGILFIAGGAFVGLGAGPARGSVEPADLIRYGFIPELAGRLQSVIHFNALSIDELEAILASPLTGPLQSWRNHFRSMGKILVIERRTLRAIAEHAHALNVGARGLQQMLFSLLFDAVYRVEDTDSKRFVLTPRRVEEWMTSQNDLERASDHVQSPTANLDLFEQHRNADTGRPAGERMLDKAPSRLRQPDEDRMRSWDIL
jgi:ATP-dependent Clp protease ATP-binding subunit ClpX